MQKQATMTFKMIVYSANILDPPAEFGIWLKHCIGEWILEVRKVYREKMCVFKCFLKIPKRMQSHTGWLYSYNILRVRRLPLLILNQDFLLCVGKEMEEIKKTMTAAPCQNNTV